jgi:hypothetical protein
MENHTKQTQNKDKTDVTTNSKCILVKFSWKNILIRFVQSQK